MATKVTAAMNVVHQKAKVKLKPILTKTTKDGMDPKAHFYLKVMMSSNRVQIQLYNSSEKVM